MRFQDLLRAPEPPSTIFSPLSLSLSPFLPRFSPRVFRRGVDRRGFDPRAARAAVNLSGNPRSIAAPLRAPDDAIFSVLPARNVGGKRGKLNVGHVDPPPSERTVVIPDIAPRVIDYRELSITADTEDGQRKREREGEKSNCYGWLKMAKRFRPIDKKRTIFP